MVKSENPLMVVLSRVRLFMTPWTVTCQGEDWESDQIRSVAQSCPSLCDPMNHSTPGLPVHHQLRSSLRLTSIESVMPSSHLILCRPLVLLPPIPPSIRVFSNESTLRMRWPKYWSFSFNVISSKEIPRLISLLTLNTKIFFFHLACISHLSPLPGPSRILSFLC